MRPTKRSIAVVALGLSVLAVAGLYLVGRELSQPRPAAIGRAPADLHAESVTFQSESGSMIHGWLSRGEPHNGAVLLLPGVGANRLSMVSRARLLKAAGYSTLLMDFQASGESPGEAITFGWRERLDVIAAVQLLKDKLPGERIGIIGTSMGGAATVLAPLLLVQVRPLLGVWPSQLTPADSVGLLRCPILVIAGAADRLTTVEDTQRFFAAASQPKELWLIPSATHIDYSRFMPDEYKRRVLALFGSALHTP